MGAAVLEAAKKMTQLMVGARPICGTDEKLKGMLTDRDVVVKVLGAGKDPGAVKAGDLAQGEAVTIGADDDAAEILRTMGEHQVRRLPVIDGTRWSASSRWPMSPARWRMRRSATCSR